MLGLPELRGGGSENGAWLPGLFLEEFLWGADRFWERDLLLVPGSTPGQGMQEWPAWLPWPISFEPPGFSCNEISGKSD